MADELESVDTDNGKKEPIPVVMFRPRSVGGGAYDPTSALVPKGYQQISEPTVSTLLTVPAGANAALIQNNGAQPARYRDDGVAPTASVGNRLIAGGEIFYKGDLSAIEFIRETAGVILDVLYYYG